MRILLVEDEIKLASAVKRALELQKHIVDVAYDGTKGLDLAIGEKFDLIILDVMLPEVDGLQICKQVRAENIHTPILMLTAKGQIEDKVTGLDMGADEYILKPFSFEELFARIRALIRRPQMTHELTLKVKDLVLDPLSFQVKRGNREIYLSTKEFALLEYLMRNKNRVLSKQQIVENLWNYDTDVLPNTVQVHMKHLRDKVDTDFNESLLFTVRGFGYKIKDQD